MVLPNWVKIYGSQFIRTEFKLNSQKLLDFDQKFEISRSYFQALNRPSEPCLSNNMTTNVSACTAKFIEEHIGCSLRIHGIKGSFRLPRCKSKEQLKKLSNITKELNEADAEAVYKLTGCLPTCEKYEYHSIDSRYSSEGSIHRGPWII